MGYPEQPIDIKPGTVEALADLEGSATRAVNVIRDRAMAIKGVVVIADGGPVGQEVTKALTEIAPMLDTLHSIYEGTEGAAKIAAAQVDNLHSTDRNIAPNLRI